MTVIFKAILNMSITGTYIAAVIMILRLLMKGLPKKYTYALWSILGIRLLFPFSFSSEISLFNLIHPDTDGNRMTYIPNDIEYSYEPQVSVSVPQINQAVNNIIPAAEPNNSINKMQIILFISAAIWLAGAAVMLIYTAASYLRVKKTVADSERICDNIYICRGIEAPFVFGIIKPKIYVPQGVSEMDMQYISAHEKTHIRRGDNVIKLIAMLALSLHWFNPLVWISYRLMVKDMELSCDEKTVRSFNGDVRRDYANALLNMSLKQNKLYGLLAFGENSIKARIKCVMSLKNPTAAVTAAAVLALSAAAICLLTDAEKLNSFEDFGSYISEKNIYMTYLSSFFGDDSGYIYEISKDSFAIINRREDAPALTYPISDWSDFPYSEEEWEKLSYFGLEAVDISGYKERLYMKLSEKYCLMKMDGELWIVQIQSENAGDTKYIWSIYSLTSYEEHT